ncbi:MAG: hypothetical protein AAGD05_18125, partial [Bacteroidota bacterium]
MRCFPLDILLGLFFWSWVAGLAGQEIAYEHFRAGRETPFSSIYGQLLQDEHGFLWLSTDRGVYRYDGQVFQHYPVANQIKDQEILYCGFTADGTLWGINLSGQLIYLPAGQDHFHLSSSSDSLNYPALRLNHTFDQKLALLAPAHLPNHYFAFTVTIDSTQPERFQLSRHLLPPLVMDYFTTKDGKEYLLSYNQDQLHLAFEVMEQGHSKSIVKIPLNKKLQIRPRLKYLPQADKLVLYVVHNQAVAPYLFDLKTPNHAQSLLLNNNFSYSQINGIFDDRLGNIWICTNNGVMGFDPQGQPLLDAHPLFGGRVIHNIFQVDDDSYWVGTQKDGLYFIPSLAVRQFRTNNSDLPSNNITVLASHPNHNNLYAGTLNSQVFEVKKGTVNLIHQFSKQANHSLYVRDLTVHNQRLVVALNKIHPYHFTTLPQGHDQLPIVAGLAKSVEVSDKYFIAG